MNYLENRNFGWAKALPLSNLFLQALPAYNSRQSLERYIRLRQSFSQTFTSFFNIKLSSCELLFIFSFLFNSTFAFSQNFEETIKYADKAFAEQKFQIATKEYQRALFFCENKQRQYLVKQLAECSFNQRNFAQAAVYYDNSYYLAKSDSMKYEMLFKKSNCLILDRKFHFAIAELFNLNDTLPYYFQRKKNFYMGVCYFGIENYRLAEQYFVNSIDSSNVEARNEVKKIFASKRSIYRPSPDAAFYMSMIIPGLGQLYAGDLKSGINSFILTTAFLALGINIAVVYRPVDAFISVLPWFYRYYQGGYAHAEKIAEVKRAENRNNSYKKILSIVAKTKN